MFGQFFGGQRSKNIYGPQAGQEQTSSPTSKFGSMFGNNSPGQAMMGSSMPQMNNTPGSFTMPGMTSPAPIPQHENQSQPRAMMPSQGFNTFWNPQSMGTPMLRNTETGQNIDLSQNKTMPGWSELMNQFKGRIQF